MAKGSEYQKRSDGNATVFDVTPAAAPKFIYLLVVGAFIVALSLAFPIAVVKAIGVAFGGAAMAFGWLYDPRPKAYRQPSTFRVTPEAIESNGRTFARADIHRLLLRNGVSDQELLTRYSSNNAQMAAMAQRARSERIANGLTVESGGKSTVLAGGMDETTAYGLLHDTCSILDFNVS